MNPTLSSLKSRCFYTRCQRLGRFWTHASQRSCHKFFAHHPQDREHEQGKELRRVLGQAAVTHLGLEVDAAAAKPHQRRLWQRHHYCPGPACSGRSGELPRSHYLRPPVDPTARPGQLGAGLGVSLQGFSDTVGSNSFDQRE